MNSNLQTTLNTQIQLGSRSNPAFNILLNDYVKYHLVLVIFGGLLLLLFIGLAIFLLARWKKVPKGGKRKWTFEKKTYFLFGLLTSFIGLLVALLVAVNATTVMNPRSGLSSLAGSINTPVAGTPANTLYQSYNTWIKSGSAHIPPLIQSNVRKRLSWQRPKAIICSILFVVSTILTTYIWHTLIRHSRAQAKWKLHDRLFMALGVLLVMITLLLMIMAVANTQGAFGPIGLALLPLT